VVSLALEESDHSTVYFRFAPTTLTLE
jgi:hypothetical protein